MVVKRGSGARDKLIGTPEADFLYGLGGDDTFQGKRGNDLIDGGAGIDTASWSEAPAHRDEFGDRYGMQIDLAAGKAVALTGFFITDPTLETDTLRGIENAIGSAYQDLIYGDARANTLWGGGARDEISGGGGNDRLYGEAGDDNLGGDDGNDRHYGGKGNDFLHGGAGDDLLLGETGNDTLRGEAGKDQLCGGVGNDLLEEGEDRGGNDVMNGGDGRDSVSYDMDARGVTIDLAAGVAFQGLEVDKLVSIEDAVGSSFADVIRGDGKANSLSGIGGNDRILGLGGDDTLWGSFDRSYLDGGSGNDTITGNGDDTILGRAGADRLSGGVTELYYFETEYRPDHDRIDAGKDQHADTLRFELYADEVVTRAINVDRVVNFDAGHDRLEFLLATAYEGDETVVDARELLDSNHNDKIDHGDREVTIDQNGMTIDLGALWERAFDYPILEGYAQKVILEGQKTAFAADVIVDVDHTLSATPGDFVF